MSEDIEARFRAITHKLWGDEEGEEIYQWIVATRPPAFHKKLIEIMVPVWEMDKVDLRVKILCAISLFTGLHRDEAEFFFKMAAHHKIPQEEVEEILMLTGLEAGFPTAEKAIVTMKTVYDAHAAKAAGK